MHQQCKGRKMLLFLLGFNLQTPQNSAISNLSPFNSCSKGIIKPEKGKKKSCGNKGFKVAHHLLLGNIGTLLGGCMKKIIIL